jgi:hypothetical protein
MLKLVGSGGASKLELLLSDPDYRLFVARGDPRIAKVLAYVAERQLAGDDWGLAYSLVGWAQVTGQTLKQYRTARRLMAKLPFVGFRKTLIEGNVNLGQIQLFQWALPDRPACAIDGKALWRGASWRKKRAKGVPKAKAKPPAKVKSSAAPASLSEPAPLPVPQAVKAPKLVPAPELPPEPEVVHKASRRPNERIVPCMISGPSGEFPLWGDPRKAARRLGASFRKETWIATLAEEFETAGGALQRVCEFSKSMREGFDPQDAWLLNTHTYENPVVAARIMAGLWYADYPHWWIGDRLQPATYDEAKALFNQVETARRARWAASKATVEAALDRWRKEHSHAQPLGWEKLVDLLRHRVVAAGFRDLSDTYSTPTEGVSCT